MESGRFVGLRGGELGEILGIERGVMVCCGWFQLALYNPPMVNVLTLTVIHASNCVYTNIFLFL